MAKVRPAGTGLELWARAVVLAAWDGECSLNDRTLPGSPDVAIPSLKLAVFADGCFWHLCPQCLKEGKVKVPPRAYWAAKLEANRRRDARVRRLLRKMGWKTLTLREHEMGSAAAAAKVKKRIEELTF